MNLLENMPVAMLADYLKQLTQDTKGIPPEIVRVAQVLAAKINQTEE